MADLWEWCSTVFILFFSPNWFIYKISFDSTCFIILFSDYRYKRHFTGREYRADERCIYCSVLNGNGSVQIIENTAAEQRSHLLLFVSDSTWSEVHSFGKCFTSWFEAEQFVIEHNVWSEGEWRHKARYRILRLLNATTLRYSHAKNRFATLDLHVSPIPNTITPDS